MGLQHKRYTYFPYYHPLTDWPQCFYLQRYIKLSNSIDEEMTKSVPLFNYL